MNISYKKWFSILGLLVAIIISLAIGQYFDKPKVESMVYMSDENLDEFQEITEEHDMTLADITDENPKIDIIDPKKKSETIKMDNKYWDDSKKQAIYKKIMESAGKEEFSVVNNF